MMMRALKAASLFLGYGLVGYGGDYAAGLLAQEPAGQRSVVEDVREPVVDVEVDVDVADLDVQVAMNHSGSCAYEVERRVALEASAVQRLRLGAGSGELAVRGREGLGQVQAVARACASDEAYLEELLLTLEGQGDDVVLSAHYPDRSGRRSWRGNDYARLDLTVEIPLNMPVDLDDGSGGMEVSGTGELRIGDSSGSIVVDGAAGAVFIEDSSGEIVVRDATGAVTIDDSSGGIDLRGAGGDVDIQDGSGEILVSGVRGSVRIRDGSGSMVVEDVTRDVVVDRDGSGSISVRDVGGGFRVRADGSGGIRYSGVSGAVDIPRKKGERRGG